MAQTLTLHDPVRLTCNATAGLVTTLTITDVAASWLRIRFITSDGFVTTAIADGVDKGSNYETYDADTVFWIHMGNKLRTGVVGLSHTDNSGVVEVTAKTERGT